jgi:hypothetical protein
VSDDYLRQLEGRWRETGDAPDEARYLLERMRAGLLPRPRLELASFLGHEAARLAIPGSASSTHDDPKRLASELWPWGKEACVAAAVTAAHSAQPQDAFAPDVRPLQAIEAAAAWVHCPCDEHVAAARVASEAALVAAGIGAHGTQLAEPRHTALSAHHAAAAAAAWPFPVAMKHAYRSIKYAEEAISRTQHLTPGELTQAICHALVLWALGPDHVPA